MAESHSGVALVAVPSLNFPYRFPPTSMGANQSFPRTAFRAHARNRSRRRLTARDKEIQEPLSFPQELKSQNRTVLVVDDDPTIRSTLAEALRAWGYEPRQAATLAETLAVVGRDRPAAVLLDVKLPDGSGISILEELKKRSPETVVIIITGYVNPRSAFEAGLRQAHGFLTKPLDETEVRSMLEEAMAKPKK